MGWIRTSKNNFCGVKAKKVFEITDKFSWKYFYMTGPGVVNIYHQACFLVLFWSMSTLLYPGMEISELEIWVDSLDSDRPRILYFLPELNETDAVLVNLLIVWLMLRWAHLSTSLVGHESLEVDILQYLTITLGKRERTRTWKLQYWNTVLSWKTRLYQLCLQKTTTTKRPEQTGPERGALAKRRKREVGASLARQI